ncbi:VC2046/SO_2500 family protein [Shewanella sp.]|uniref:VC2046/SO_2500 family protein n=1 Tax=Shewanella sp. TaxID=50422 RepID=UPI003D128503
MRTSQLLINENHLGSRLNQAVTEHRRGEFGLLLAMLSSDARDLAQFHLDGMNLDSEAKLKRQFDLPEPQALTSELHKGIDCDNSGAFHQAGLSGFHLQQYLSPEPLVHRGRDPLAMQEVLANCDPITAARFHGELTVDAHLLELPHFTEQIVKQRALGDILA